MPPHHLILDDLHLTGESRAGAATWFRVDPPGIALDAGRGAPPLAGCATLLLTHGHLDHALGVPYLLSERTVHGSELTRIACPAATAPALESFLGAAAALESSRYDVEVIGCAPGERIELGRDVSAEGFAVDHPVPALGWHLWRRRSRLRPDLAGTSGEELAARRRRGEAVDEEYEELLLSYCGDTGPAVLESEPRLFEARVLLIECTFLDPAHADRGRDYGHLHLDDLVAVADRFRNRAVVLHHLSRRHTPAELVRAVAERAPQLAGRVRVWGVES